MSALAVGLTAGDFAARDLLKNREYNSDYASRVAALRSRMESDDSAAAGSAQAWLPDGYSQIFRLYLFGPLGFWTMAPLRCTAKFDPFLSLDCAPALHPDAIQGKEGIKFCIEA